MKMSTGITTGSFQASPKVRRRYCISTLIEQAEVANGIDTRKLRAGDTLVIRTCNTFYTLQLADPSKGSGVANSDGKHVTEESRASLLGATLSGTGTMVKMGWVLLGFRMVLFVPGKELVTSPVRGVAINGVPLVPAAGTH